MEEKDWKRLDEKDWNRLHKRILRKIILDIPLDPTEIESLEKEFKEGTAYLQRKSEELKRGKKRLKKDNEKLVASKKAKLNSKKAELRSIQQSPETDAMHLQGVEENLNSLEEALTKSLIAQRGNIEMHDNNTKAHNILVRLRNKVGKSLQGFKECQRALHQQQQQQALLQKQQQQALLQQQQQQQQQQQPPPPPRPKGRRLPPKKRRKR